MTCRPRLAAAMMSSCLQELPAATALAVATVMGLVCRISSSAEMIFSTWSVDTYTCVAITWTMTVSYNYNQWPQYVGQCVHFLARLIINTLYKSYK